MAWLLVAYALPWVVTAGASGQNTALSFGAYDLAEWASLAPDVQSETPPLLTAFLLRAPLACLGLFAAFALPNRWIGVLVALVVAAALLPPPEFVRDPGSMNYRQQLGLAAITFVGGLLAASGLLRRSHGLIAIGTGVLGVVASVVGLARGHHLMLDFDLVTTVGSGGVLAALGFGLVALLMVYREWGARR